MFFYKNPGKLDENCPKPHEFLCLIFTRVLSGFHDLGIPIPKFGDVAALRAPS